MFAPRYALAFEAGEQFAQDGLRTQVNEQRRQAGQACIQAEILGGQHKQDRGRLQGTREQIGTQGQELVETVEFVGEQICDDGARLVLVLASRLGRPEFQCERFAIDEEAARHSGSHGQVGEIAATRLHDERVRDQAGDQSEAISCAVVGVRVRPGSRFVRISSRVRLGRWARARVASVAGRRPSAIKINAIHQSGQTHHLDGRQDTQAQCLQGDDERELRPEESN